jgi:hypothetical protein
MGCGGENTDTLALSATAGLFQWGGRGCFWA